MSGQSVFTVVGLGVNADRAENEGRDPGSHPPRLGVDPELARLYELHAARLTGMMWAFLGDRAAAEDVVQDTFLRVGRRWRDVRDITSAPAYLRSTAFNVARSRLRRRVVALRHQAEPPGFGPSAEERTMLRADQQEVASALRALSPRQRACLVLRYYDDMTDAQIADDLGLSPSSVKTHVARGLATLETRLRGRL